MTIVILLAFWLRVERLDTFPPGLSNDEALNPLDVSHFSDIGKIPFYENVGEPEPLYRIILTLGTLVFGKTIWVFRFMSAAIGTLTVASCAWVMRECMREEKVEVRWWAALFAAASLAIALGHITLSRSLYRAILQPLFMLLFTGFALRSFRKNNLRDAIWSGASLASAMYSYTAGLSVPILLAPLGLSLLLFRRAALKQFALIVIITMLFFSPVIWLLITDPMRVLARANEVGAAPLTFAGLINLVQRITDMSLYRALWAMYFVKGDINPQYNTNEAPVVPVFFQWAFALGVIFCLWRARRVESLMILTSTVVVAIPVFMAQEIPHGLRIAGVWAMLPLIVGAGGALLFKLIPLRLYNLLALASATMIIISLVVTRQTYIDYWSKTFTWRMFGYDLSYGEWFFRTDRRDFARWLTQQNTPLLLPLDELNSQTVRAFLLARYPNVRIANEDVEIPKGTHVVLPWGIELGDYRGVSCCYGLLQDDAITILPMLSDETRAHLLSGSDQVERITRNGTLKEMALVYTLPSDFKIKFQPRSAESKTPIVTFDNGMRVMNWRGINTFALSDKEQAVTYTVEWMTRFPQQRDYLSFVGLLTQDQKIKKAGVDAEMLRWLYPTWVWQPDQIVPVQYKFTVPANLETGAYRLTVGVDGKFQTIGWLKVSQPAPPPAGAGQVQLSMVAGDKFKVTGASVSRLDNEQIRLSLFWESLTERPPTDAIIFIHLQHVNSNMVAQTDQKPWQGQYPTFIWSQGERVRTDYTFNIGQTSLEDIELWMGLYTYPGPIRLPLVNNGQPVKDARVRLGKLSEMVER